MWHFPHLSHGYISYSKIGTQGQEGSEVNLEDQPSPGNQNENLVTTNTVTKTPLHSCFVPLPASTNMYWVSESKVELKLGQDVGDGGASGNTSLEDDQGYYICVERLASLGFQCIEQLDGTLPPSPPRVLSTSKHCFSCLDDSAQSSKYGVVLQTASFMCHWRTYSGPGFHVAIIWCYSTCYLLLLCSFRQHAW